MLQLLRLSWSAISTLPFSTDGASCWCKCNESLWSVLTGLHHGMTRVRNVVTGAPGQWLLPEQLSGCSPASAAAATATCFGCSGTHPASSSAQEGQFFARSMHFVISSLAGYISACHALQYALLPKMLALYHVSDQYVQHDIQMAGLGPFSCVVFAAVTEHR